MYKENIIEFFSNYSEQFDKKIASLDLYNQSYIDFVNRTKNKRNLLDLACGPGNVSLFIKKLVPNINITCVDLSDKMLDLAKSKLKTGVFYKSDILNIQIPHKYYDLIVCAFGLPYVEKSEINKFVSEIDKFANKDTVIYVSSMQGHNSVIEDMSFASNEKILIHYHNKETIVNNFSEFGFNLIDYKEQDYPEMNGSVTIDMIFNFKKSN